MGRVERNLGQQGDNFGIPGRHLVESRSERLKKKRKTMIAQKMMIHVLVGIKLKIQDNNFKTIFQIMSLIASPLVVSQSQNLMEIQSKAIHILQKMRSFIQKKISTQKSPIAQNRKLNAEIFSYEDQVSNLHQLLIIKPGTSKPVNIHSSPFISVFPASTVHKEEISKDARKN